MAVNNNVDLSKYSEMVYGWCLHRVIHFVVWLRVRYPGVRIQLAKFDYSDAFQRIRMREERQP